MTIREKQEQLVLDHIREHHGYFSIFWAMENRLRAAALERLANSGRIVRCEEQPRFPLNRYTVAKS